MDRPAHRVTGRGSWTPLGGAVPATFDGTTYGYYQYVPGMKIFVGQQAAKDPKLDVDYKEYRAVTAGVSSIQNALNREFNARLVPDGVFGPLTGTEVEAAQRSYGLVVGFTPGRVGTTLATRLFRGLVTDTEAGHGIPGHYLGGLLHLESGGFDPGSVGEVSDLDNGLAQFHVDGSRTWWNSFSGQPEEIVTHGLAFEPGWAVEQAGRRMAYYLARYSGKGAVLQDQCAIAQHNAPGWADQWFVRGVPPNPTIAQYVGAVMARARAY